MGLRIRKQIKLGKNVKLNLSNSGISTSVKVGNTTFNNKRGATTRLANGVSYGWGNARNNNKHYSGGIIWKIILFMMLLPLLPIVFPIFVAYLILKFIIQMIKNNK